MQLLTGAPFLGMIPPGPPWSLWLLVKSTRSRYANQKDFRLDLDNLASWDMRAFPSDGENERWKKGTTKGMIFSRNSGAREHGIWEILEGGGGKHGTIPYKEIKWGKAPEVVRGWGRRGRGVSDELTEVRRVQTDSGNPMKKPGEKLKNPFRIGSIINYRGVVFTEGVWYWFVEIPTPSPNLLEGRNSPLWEGSISLAPPGPTSHISRLLQVKMVLTFPSTCSPRRLRLSPSAWLTSRAKN